MKKTEQSKPMRTEPRWPVVLNLFGVLLVFTQLSTRVHLLPTWFPYVIVLVILVPIAGVRLSGASPMWRTIERFATFGFCLLVGATIIVTLMYLINQMLHHGTEFSGQQLFTSSIGGWIGNVLVFSLVYWQIDRDGPEARMNDEGKTPDWLFPQAGHHEDMHAHWVPTYVDYLFLAFSTATAFSAADTMPLTHRAKLLMMLETSISMVTLVIVASRAIGLLDK